MNSLIFLNSYEFSQFFYVFEFFFCMLKNERNGKNFGYVFVARFHITLKKNPSDRTLRVTALNFFLIMVFSKI